MRQAEVGNPPPHRRLRGLVRQALRQGVALRDISQIQLRYVRSFDDACDFRQWLGQRRQFLGLDTETEGLNVGRDRVRLVQFGDATAGWAFDYRDWRGLIKETVEEYRGDIAVHNLLFDSKMLLKDGIRIPQRNAHDTLVMAHLDNPARWNSLKPLSKFLVHPAAAAVGQGELKKAFAGGGWDWATIPVDHPAYWTYSAFDTCLGAMVAEELWPRIQNQREWYEVELACIHVLRDAELAGMGVDLEYCDAAIRQLAVEQGDLAQRIPVEKIGSDAQVRNYLLSIGVPLTHKTEKGALSTQGKVLRLHAEDYPVAGYIADWRSKERNRKDYLMKMVEMQADGRVHANVHPVQAVTGRMSVTEPPLQTLPRGRVVRDAFVPAEGCSFVIADYAQMEMRVMAADAGEQPMLDAFNRGEDMHNFVARAAYGDGFTKKQRGTAKNSAFAKIYGAGVDQFAATAGIPVQQAAEFLERYDELFPGVRRWQEQMIQGVRATAPGRKRTGYVMTVAGRKVPLPVDEAYKACNYRIQGTCSEILKRKIVELDNAGVGEFFRLPVHDELIFEVPDALADEVRCVVEAVMPDRETFAGKIDLECESNVVKRWGANYEGDDYPVYVKTWED